MESIKGRVAAYVLDNFMMGSGPEDLREHDSFMGRHIIDSTGFVELISYLEETFGIKVEDQDMVPANLDSLASIEQFVLRKQADVPAAVRA
jgi:acyl carrier protein